MRKATILAITRTKISLVKVSLSLPKSIKIINEWQWSNDDLSRTLEDILHKEKLNKVRVLVADDLAYSLELEIDKGLKSERDFIAKEIEKEIPELLENQDWDYSVTKETKEKKKVLVFALVGNLWKVLKEFFQQSNVEVEAIESISLAQKRNKNPFIALTEKKDIRGNDDEVLNLTLDVDKKTPFLSYFLVFLLISVLVFIFLLLSNKKDKEFLVQNSIPVNEEKTVAEEAPVIIEEEELDLFKYKIYIQNGSGLAGEGALVGDILEESGFQVDQITNADSFDYQETEIILGKEVEQEFFKYIEDVLNDQYQVVSASSSGNLSSENDILIIVGKLKIIN